MGTNAAKGSVKDMAACMGKLEENDEDEYTRLYNELSRILPGTPGDHISDHMPEIESLASQNPLVMPLVKRAMSIEGVCKQYGMHAAGVIIADNDRVADYVPLAYDEKSKQWKCQCDMVRAEASGLLKFDFLGLKNLNIITEILRNIYKNHGKRIDPQTDIKEEKEVIQSIVASGKTNFVFQLEGSGIKEVAKDLSPDSFEDLILLIAAYRPGPMEKIPDMIKVKKGQQKPNYITPELESILSKTYGTAIYQEQVQQIFQKLAGYSLGRADLVRRAMSKKKEKELLKEKPLFIEGCEKNGISAEKATRIFDDMVDFAKYAFNKSHAAVYARVTYITAWLKYYYPTEFMAVSMKYAKREQLISLVAECKQMNIKVRPIDVNVSETDFLPSPDGSIYFGLRAINGIVNVDPIIKARKEMPFKNFADFMIRGHFKKDITESLIHVGAFDSFVPNRQSVQVMFDEMLQLTKKREDILKNISLYERYASILDDFQKDESIKDLTENVRREKLMECLKEAGYKNKTVLTEELIVNKINSLKLDIEVINHDIEEAGIIPAVPTDMQMQLSKEKEITGVYITGHPLDHYKPAGISIMDFAKNVKRIVSIQGVITDILLLHRKNDGAPFAKVTLDTKEGEVTVMFFTKSYEANAHILQKDSVVIIMGKVMEEKRYSGQDDNDDNAEEVVYKIFAKGIKPAVRVKRRAMIHVHDIFVWQSLVNAGFFDSIKSDSDDAMILLVHFEIFDEIRTAEFCVSEELLRSKDLYGFIKPEYVMI